MMIRIEQALARAKEQGNKVQKRDLAARLWPDSAPATQQVNMTCLCSGRTKKIAPEWVGIICEMTGCTADFLFGISNE